MVLSTQTYVEWLRTAEPQHMMRADHRKLEEEKQWIAANPKEHARLLAMVGQRVTLIQDRTTFAGTVLPAGTEFFIFEQFMGSVYGRLGGYVYSLRPNWVQLVVDPKKKKTASG